MKHVRGIRINFENCESTDELTVASHEHPHDADVLYLELEGVTSNVCSLAVNCTAKFKECKKCYFELAGHKNLRFETWGCENMSLINRIAKFNDIVSITVVYEDEDEEEIIVRWKTEEFSCENAWQKSKVDDYGNLIVSIKKRKEKKHV